MTDDSSDELVDAGSVPSMPAGPAPQLPALGEQIMMPTQDLLAVYQVQVAHLANAIARLELKAASDAETIKRLEMENKTLKSKGQPL